MERNSLMKNFILLTVGSLLALHLNLAKAANDKDESTTSPDASDACVLEQE